MTEPVADGKQTPAADYLLQRFLGYESVQAMRRALSGFPADHQDDQAETYSSDGELRHQPSLTMHLRAKPFGTDLGAFWAAAYHPLNTTRPCHMPLALYCCCYICETLSSLTEC